MKLRFDRRQFLRGTFGSLGAMIAARAGWLFPEGRQVLARARSTIQEGVALQPPVEGELYAGFLLLPEGAPVPATVKYSRLGIPIACGVGVGRGGPELTSVTKPVATPADLAREGHFPAYTLSKLPEGLRPAGGYLIKHISGESFGGLLSFETHNAQTNSWEPTVRIWAQPDFPRPFPMWSSNPVEPEGLSVTLEKVDFLPSPGILIRSTEGHVFLWIENDVLYMLTAEYGQSLEESQALVASLARVES